MSHKVPSLQNFEWQQAVDDRASAPTGSEVKGYRYIITTGTGTFSGYNNYIATAKVSNPSSSSDWNFDTPSEGMITYVKDENILYIYISSWNIFSLGDFAPANAKYLIGDVTDVSSLSNEILTKNVGLENLIINGDFEHWHAGTNVAPTGWGVYAGSVSRESTEVKINSYSLKQTVQTSFHQDLELRKGLNFWKGRTITASCWAKCSTSNRACLYLHDGLTNSALVYHSGGGDWELLTVTHTISSGATKLQIHTECRNGDATMYFDGVMLVEGSVPFSYCSNFQDIAGLEITSAPAVVGKNFDIAKYSSSGTRRLYMCDGTDWKYVAIAT